jgi:DNA polymerase-1
MLLNVMLNGMPMDDEEIESLDLMLLKIIHEQQEAISANPIIQDFNEVLRIDACEKANSKLKVKKKDIAEFEDVVFNPNSDKQLQKLLFAIHELPIFDLTDTKQPSTGNDTLKKLLVHLEKSYDIKESDYD